MPLINFVIRPLFLIVLFSLLSKEFSFGQTSFQKTIGETDFYNRGNSVKQTKDGGYIVAGRTVSYSGGGVQAYLVKTNPDGSTLWSKNYGGPGSEEATSIQVTYDNGFIFTGYTNSFGEGNKDVYLVKTDGNGDTLWTRAYGGPGIDGGNSVWETKDHGFIIAGETYSFGSGNVNAYLIRTNEAGDTLWTCVFGGNGIEQGNSVKETSDGGFVITGRTNSFGAGDYDFYLIKTNKNGDKTWMQTFGGSGTEEGSSVIQTKDGGFAITGYTKTFGEGGTDVYLARADANGNQIWTKTFGGKTDDYGMELLETADGGFIIAGSTNSFGNGVAAYLIRTDVGGSALWTKTYGKESDDYGNSLGKSADGGYVIAGSTIYTAAEGETIEKITNVYLIKTTATGN